MTPTAATAAARNEPPRALPALSAGGVVVVLAVLSVVDEAGADVVAGVVMLALLVVMNVESALGVVLGEEDMVVSGAGAAEVVSEVALSSPDSGASVSSVSATVVVVSSSGESRVKVGSSTAPVAVQQDR